MTKPTTNQSRKTETTPEQDPHGRGLRYFFQAPTVPPNSSFIHVICPFAQSIHSPHVVLSLLRRACLASAPFYLSPRSGQQPMHCSLAIALIALRVCTIQYERATFSLYVLEGFSTVFWYVLLIFLSFAHLRCGMPCMGRHESMLFKIPCPQALAIGAGTRGTTSSTPPSPFLPASAPPIRIRGFLARPAGYVGTTAPRRRTLKNSGRAREILVAWTFRNCRDIAVVASARMNVLDQRVKTDTI